MSAAEDYGDLEDDVRPPDASQLSGKQLAEELEKRGLKVSGFADDDIRMLQRAFDAEFERDRAERMRVRAEMMAKRRADEERLRMQRFLESQKREEEEAVVSDKRVSFWMELIRGNRTPEEMVWRIDPVAVRALSKAMPANTSLRALDLSNSRLHDDVGMALGRMLGSNCGIQRLDLDHNQLGPATLTAIADGLASNASSALVSLSLERNPLTGDPPGRDYSGLRAFCVRVLAAGAEDDEDDGDEDEEEGEGRDGFGRADGRKSKRCRLLNLNLFQTGLRREGGKLLVHALRSNTTLTHLQLAPTDDLEAADLSSITDVLRDNARAAAESSAAAKASRAAARRAAEASRKVAEAEAAAAAEVAWIEAQKAARAAARQRAEEEEALREARARMEREAEEAERRAKWRAEAEADAKKAAAKTDAKAKGGKKK